MRVRREKRQRLLDEGVEPTRSPSRAPTTLAEIRAAYPDLPPDTDTGREVGVTGRVIFLRNSGKLCFATLREGGAGEPAPNCRSWCPWPGGRGIAGRIQSRRRPRRPPVRATARSSPRAAASCRCWPIRWAIAAKALRPLPVAHKPLSEETRVRQRYVDLIVRPQARRTVEIRAAVNRSLRSDAARARLSRGRNADAAGAARRRRGPAVRHAHAMPWTWTCTCASRRSCTSSVRGRRHRAGLRDQPQLPQRGRRLHRIRPSSPCWRRTRRTPTTTAWPTLTRELMQKAAMAVSVDHVAVHGRRHRIRPRRRVADDHVVRRAVRGARARRSRSRPRSRPLVRVGRGLGVAVAPHHGPGKLVEELFDALVRDALVRARHSSGTIPVETAPLTRAHRSRTRRGRKVGPVHPRGRDRDRLLGAGRPGHPARALRRPGAIRRPAATPRRCGWTRSSCARWSTGCRRRAGWAWESTD